MLIKKHQQNIKKKKTKNEGKFSGEEDGPRMKGLEDFGQDTRLGASCASLYFNCFWCSFFVCSPDQILWQININTPN